MFISLFKKELLQNLNEERKGKERKGKKNPNAKILKSQNW